MEVWERAVAVRDASGAFVRANAVRPLLAAVILVTVARLLSFDALREAWRSSRDDGLAGSVAFAACPMLTQAAVEALYHHGTEAQKKKYLPKAEIGRAHV